MNLRYRLAEFFLVFVALLTSYGSASAQITHNVVAGFDQSVAAATQPIVGLFKDEEAGGDTSSNARWRNAHGSGSSR